MPTGKTVLPRFTTMEVRRSYEGLEAAPVRATQDPSSDTAQYPYYAQHQSQTTSPFGYPSPPPQYGQAPEKDHAAQQIEPVPGFYQKKSRKKWWIIGVVLLLIVAAAVGGGVGGTLGAKKASATSGDAK